MQVHFSHSDSFPATCLRASSGIKTARTYYKWLRTSGYFTTHCILQWMRDWGRGLRTAVARSGSPHLCFVLGIWESTRAEPACTPLLPLPRRQCGIRPETCRVKGPTMAWTHLEPCWAAFGCLPPSLCAPFLWPANSCRLWGWPRSSFFIWMIKALSGDRWGAPSHSACKLLLILQTSACSRGLYTLNPNF